MDLRDPLDLNSPEPKPLTTFRVVVIAALVAFVIGSLPALGTAIIVSSNLNADSQSRTRETCQIIRDGREQANRKNAQNRLNLRADIAVYETVLKFTPRKVPAGAQITQIQLDKYLHVLRNAIATKKNKILPLTQDLILPNCAKISS